MTDWCDKDLEKHGQGCEEEEVELPEDRPSGKLKYFTSLWIVQGEWIFQFILTAPLLFGPFFWLSFCQVSRISTIVLVLFSHHCMFVLIYAQSWSFSYDEFLDKKTLGMWLEEVGNADMGDPEAWRRIAFRVNQTKCHHDPFYSGKQCRRFFVQQVVEPVESNTYKVLYSRSTWSKAENFCDNSSNKLLVQRAVDNYKKSAQFSETDKKEQERKRIEAHEVSMDLIMLDVLIFLVEIVSFLFISLLYTLIGALRGTSA